MRSIKWIILILLMFLVVRCADQTTHVGNHVGPINSFYVDLPDGRKVICVSWSNATDAGAGFSCDWQSAR